jgi:hypothetical protein
MYLVNYGILKFLELTINHLEVGKLERNFIWGPPNDATIDNNNVLFH